MYQEDLMYGMPNLIGLYVFILLLWGIELYVRNKRETNRFEDSFAKTIVKTESIVRIVVLICAIPLLHLSSLFIFMLGFAIYIPSSLYTIMVGKWIVFSVWGLLLLLKAFLERKHLDTRTAILTMGFGFPIIALLYSIYTYMF